MAEEEESGCAHGDGSGEWGPDPENGRAGGLLLLQERAERAVGEHLVDIVGCILDNIRAKHLPSVKLLFDLAGRLKRNEDVPAAEYQSLAEVLWKAFQELETGEEQVAENR